MSQNGQTYFKNLAANAARFLKYVWPFWGIMHERVNETDTPRVFIQLFSLVDKSIKISTIFFLKKHVVKKSKKDP